MIRRAALVLVATFALAACGGKLSDIAPEPTECAGDPCEPPHPTPKPPPKPTDPRPEPTTPLPPDDPTPPDTRPTQTPCAGADDPGCMQGSAEWEMFAFTYDRAETACAGGERWVRFNAHYAKWVGAELCSSERYKLFLGETRDGVFHEIGDFAGNGQDHCELVNPSFTIPNEDEITSGTCQDCAVEMGAWESPGPVPVYTRHRFGQPFELGTWPEYNLYTSRWYECGVSIGE